MLKEEFNLFENAFNRSGVLIVEDEPNFRELLARIVISDLGKWAIAAEDGNTAYQILKANPHRINLVICDICLPMFDGIELLRLTKRHEATRHINFVFVTNHDSPENRERADVVGASRILSKRCINNPLDLAKKLAQAIEALT